MATELAPFSGADGSAIYIALDGIVFDVTSHPSGRDFYGPGCGYNIFAGKDATIGLSTMQLDPAKWDVPLASLTPAQRETLAQWVGKFMAKYEVRGCLRGTGAHGTLPLLREKLAAVEAAAAAADASAAAAAAAAGGAAGKAQ